MKISPLIFLPLMIIGLYCSKNNEREKMRKQFDDYFKALNEHEIEKILSFLSDDFQLHFTEYDFKIDKNGLVDVLGWDKGVNGVVSYENLEVAGDCIKGIFTERNEFFKLLDIQELKATITYKFDNSRLIVKQIYAPLPNQPSFQENMQPAIDWASTNRPDELNEIYPDNQMQFNQEMAERWVALLKEWRKATQAERK
ncbi:hypothetical protein GWN42_20230 [candidate division KSB1 bacterium]|nr:hypothetical protein [candidate division KSB1 bacterium]